MLVIAPNEATEVSKGIEVLNYTLKKWNFEINDTKNAVLFKKIKDNPIEVTTSSGSQGATCSMFDKIIL